jgi:hypothetical protein
VVDLAAEILFAEQGNGRGSLSEHGP